MELFEVFTRHLKKHLIQKQEVALCSTILGAMLTHLHHEHARQRHPNSAAAREVEILVLVLLETLIYGVKDLDRSSAVAVSALFSLP